MEFVINLQSFLQSCNKSLINQTCSGPYWENIGPRSFLYGPRCARSVLSRPRADILPVRPSRLVNKIYQEPINRSLHMHCILESTFARIFLFLELPFLQEAQFYRENLSQSSSLEEFPDLPAITVTFRRGHFM